MTLGEDPNPLGSQLLHMGVRNLSGFIRNINDVVSINFSVGKILVASGS